MRGDWRRMQCCGRTAASDDASQLIYDEHAPVEFEMTHDEVCRSGRIQMRAPCRLQRHGIMICWRRPRPRGRPTVAVGTGVPCAAAMLAQRTTPRALHPLGSRRHRPRLPTMPSASGDSRTFYKAAMATSMATSCRPASADGRLHLPRRCPDRRFGNLNSTMVGRRLRQTKVRFPLRRRERPG